MCRTSLAAVFMIAGLLAGCGGPQRPQWVAEPHGQFPEARYLAGVGEAGSRVEAEDRARAEIAKIFQVRIEARDLSREEFSSGPAGSVSGGRYRQEASSELEAVTSRLLSGVRIAETWQDERRNRHYALAVLDRQAAAAPLRRELADVDLRLAGVVDQARSADARLAGLGALLSAIDLLKRREPLVADLAVLDAAGYAPQPPVGRAEIEQARDELIRQMHFNVELEGDDGGVVRGAVIKALARTGLRLAPAFDQDLLLRGRVSLEEYRRNDPWHWTLATAQMEFLDREGRVFDAVRATVREGSQIAARSRLLAREKLGQEVADKLLQRLQRLGRGE